MMFRIPIRHHVVMQGKLFDIRQWLVERCARRKDAAVNVMPSLICARMKIGQEGDALASHRALAWRRIIYKPVRPMRRA